MAKYAYARALQKGQSLNKQIQSFSQFGVPKENIFTDEGVTSRGAYGELLQTLKRGDLLVIKTLSALVIKTLSALGEGYGAIATEWSRITGANGADICVLDMPALDTRLGSDREVISSVVVQLMNFCDERVRKQTALQAKGIQAAKQRGVKFGRPPKKYGDEFISAARRFKSGEITMKEALVLILILILTGMKQSSFYYHIQKLNRLNYFN